jgi:hypothetical protein
VISLHFNNLYPLLHPGRLLQLASCHPADYHGLCKPAVDFVEQVPVTRNLSYGGVVQLLFDFNYLGTQARNGKWVEFSEISEPKLRIFRSILSHF